MLEFLTAVLSTLAALFGLLQIDAARNALGRVVSRVARHRTRVVLAVLALAVSAGSIVAYRELGQRAGERDDSNASMLALRSFLPPDLRKSCVPADGGEPSAVAALSCEAPGAKITVTYVLFGDERALADKLKSRKERLALPDGRCEQATSAHVTFRGTDKRVSGELLCYATDDGQALEWSDTALRVYATANQRGGGDRGNMLAWWRAAGPSLTYARLDFPDADESWLLQRIPVDFRRSCERGSQYRPKLSIAAVVCAPGPPTNSIWYVRFQDNKAMDAYFNERAAGSTETDVVKCRDNRSTWADYPLTGTYRGRRFCWVSEETNTPWIEWTDPRMSIYSQVDTRGSNIARLADWWWKKSGPHPPDE